MEVSVQNLSHAVTKSGIAFVSLYAINPELCLEVLPQHLELLRIPKHKTAMKLKFGVQWMNFLSLICKFEG